MPAVLNAANEAAVYAFLDRRIGFQHIVIVVAESMSRIGNVSDPSIEDIIQAGLEAEVVAESLIKEKKL
jgi:1-deoxy-D-xylulose-5-phosphate reductoisomerase